MSGNYCEQIPVIPQNLGTCWFNAIIMAMIYSDGLSQFIYEKAIEDNWQDNNNGAFKTLMLLFMNYVRAIKKGKVEYIENLRFFLKKYKIEIILLDFLKHYHTELIKEYYDITTSNGYYLSYLSYILEILGINSTLNIYKISKFFYENVKYDFINLEHYANDNNNNHPDILLFKENYSRILNRTLKYDNSIGEEIIEFNGFHYKLDCILLNDKNKKHAITGLTCNGSKYIYNGWWKKRNDKNPCNLMPFDWTTDTTNFCLNEMECSLLPKDLPLLKSLGKGKSLLKPLPKDLSKGNLCFNFKNNERLMVYVRIKDDVELEIKQIKEINRVKISSYIDNLDIETIKKILKTKYNDEFIEKVEKEDLSFLRRLFRYFLYKKHKINSISPEESLSIINDTTSIEHI